MLTSSTVRAAAAVGASMLLLSACGADTEPEPVAADEETDEATDEGDAPDGEPDSDEDSGPEANGDDEADGEPVGSLTVNGETVELERALWCTGYDRDSSGPAEQHFVAFAHDLVKVTATVGENADGVPDDHVQIYPHEELSSGVTTILAEDEDGYPWIEVDGQSVTLEGTDDSDGEEVAFEGEFEVGEEPHDGFHCPDAS